MVVRWCGRRAGPLTISQAKARKTGTGGRAGQDNGKKGLGERRGPVSGGKCQAVAGGALERRAKDGRAPARTLGWQLPLHSVILRRASALMVG